MKCIYYALKRLQRQSIFDAITKQHSNRENIIDNFRKTPGHIKDEMLKTGT